MFLISDLYSYISGVILGVHRKLYEVMFLMSYPSTISLVLSCLWDSLFGASAKELETSLYYVLPINYTHVQCQAAGRHREKKIAINFLDPLGTTTFLITLSDMRSLQSLLLLLLLPPLLWDCLGLGCERMEEKNLNENRGYPSLLVF